MPTRKIKRATIRSIILAALLSALGVYLTQISFPIPLMPSFIEFNFFFIVIAVALFLEGLTSALCVCVVRSLLYLPLSHSMGIGEIADLGVSLAFVFGAWAVLRLMKKRTLLAYVLAAVAGSLAGGLISLPINYFVIYPLYISAMHFPLEAILAAYQKINPSATSLTYALAVFNIPFSIAKCGVCAGLGVAVSRAVERALPKREEN